MGDDELMAGAAQAQEAALAELYRRYERPLLAYARRRLDDRMAAEELVQETLVRLWRMAPRFDAARGTVDCLVFTIASRVVVDVLRKARRAAPVDLVDADDVPAHAPDRDLAMALRAALGDLSTEHRTVLHLAYFDGLTQREIADRIGVPLGTVKTRTFFGLRALHDALAACV